MNPLERKPQVVVSDVLGGIVSEEAARDIYGVAIDPETHELDLDGTNKLRLMLREARLKL